MTERSCRFGVFGEKENDDPDPQLEAQVGIVVFQNAFRKQADFKICFECAYGLSSCGVRLYDPRRSGESNCRSKARRG